jgi:RNA polymerase sigma-70 factor, ECF subfamily
MKTSIPDLAVQPVSAAVSVPQAEPEDAVLLRRMLAGDEEAFDLLYTRRARGVYQFALRMSGSVALAEDVTQDVFLSLMRSGHLFDATRGTLQQYLLGMTRNRVLTLLQRERHFVPLAVEEGEDDQTLFERAAPQEDPLFELSRNERIEAVRQAVLALPLHYREVVVFCNLDELSYEEAAQLIGCPVGTVRSRLNRARALLLEKLQANHGAAGYSKLAVG